MCNFLLEKLKASPNQRMSYADYMNAALYDEQHGYYMNERIKIGRHGDFYTSSHVSSVFGTLFASLFIKLVETGRIPPCICELGGGDGVFARAVLQEWKNQSPHTYQSLTYILIEISPYQRTRQAEILGEFAERVIQYRHFDDFCKKHAPFSGIMFSNEFFDALPVHVIKKEKGQIYELFVALRENELVEEPHMLQNEQIIVYLQERNIVLKEGQRLEVPLAMKSFLLENAHVFAECVMITVDYGYTDEEWANPARHQGSLRGYYQHRLIRDPLAYPGQMDLTAHIQWDALRMYGNIAGWEWVQTIRQDRFLLAAGILTQLKEHDGSDPFSEQSKRNRAIRSLMMDEGMSAFFQVMIQQKNLQMDWEKIWVEPSFL
ncbi:hypothetical protein AT864_00348 [Anoxybacillus sp. P3H1B]|uniref:class I SAM-dependent methyltransferase n=1 Tax=unclassified Anoxybacillus TaxID=2639704 RepID=UPI00079BBF10|nr:MULTISPECIES: SAM-dependent methyltransferase [unclassified Anoxybacillus]KXG11265.1 hypothetical protein AT864_00348 [Anoxybacillus sp. P3H1B]OQM44954.1 SAM-dependent methyltransferase [Anoxybacillus sp. UARK-01]